jgi:uncharacterized Zn finger protein
MPSIADVVEEPKLRELVDDAVWSRGRQLAEVGAVRLGRFGPLGGTAEVEDSGLLQVSLTTSGSGDLQWSCTCGADRFCVHATAAAIECWRRAPKRR